MTAHVWTSVMLAGLTEDEAANVHGSDDREQAVTLSVLAGVTDVGVVCRDCRVSYADVRREKDNPWPCPGVRPRNLGGPLGADHQSPSRNVRRAARRQAVSSITQQQATVRLAGRRAAETARFTKSTSEQEV